MRLSHFSAPRILNDAQTPRTLSAKRDAHTHLLRSLALAPLGTPFLVMRRTNSAYL